MHLLGKIRDVVQVLVLRRSKMWKVIHYTDFAESETINSANGLFSVRGDFVLWLRDNGVEFNLGSEVVHGGRS